MSQSAGAKATHSSLRYKVSVPVQESQAGDSVRLLEVCGLDPVGTTSRKEGTKPLFWRRGGDARAVILSMAPQRNHTLAPLVMATPGSIHGPWVLLGLHTSRSKHSGALARIDMSGARSYIGRMRRPTAKGPPSPGHYSYRYGRHQQHRGRSISGARAVGAGSLIRNDRLWCRVGRPLLRLRVSSSLSSWRLEQCCRRPMSARADPSSRLVSRNEPHLFRELAVDYVLHDRLALAVGFRLRRLLPTLDKPWPYQHSRSSMKSLCRFDGLETRSCMGFDRLGADSAQAGHLLGRARGLPVCLTLGFRGRDHTNAWRISTCIADTVDKCCHGFDSRPRPGRSSHVLSCSWWQAV